MCIDIEVIRYYAIGRKNIKTVRSFVCYSHGFGIKGAWTEADDDENRRQV